MKYYTLKRKLICWFHPLSTNVRYNKRLRRQYKIREKKKIFDLSDMDYK